MFLQGGVAGYVIDAATCPVADMSPIYLEQQAPLSYTDYRLSPARLESVRRRNSTSPEHGVSPFERTNL